MGDEKIRFASPPQTAQMIDSGAMPSGHTASSTPCCSHRCSYIAMTHPSHDHVQTTAGGVFLGTHPVDAVVQYLYPLARRH